MAETIREKVAMEASSRSMFGENCSITRKPTSSRCFASSTEPSSRTVKASSYVSSASAICVCIRLFDRLR